MLNLFQHILFKLISASQVLQKLPKLQVMEVPNVQEISAVLCFVEMAIISIVMLNLFQHLLSEFISASQVIQRFQTLLIMEIPIVHEISPALRFIEMTIAGYRRT
ncbi:hypothetical protein [Christiangramia sabulilitoris]|uniref:Uncharacterized protein n=1 Tax=Christiangramia sabulilitoris TaxID=2583991 RepID=A0A550HZR8_9FLAO|nr:hypothetical protein [Christiangramia sabulilitoris]TRO64175.1 hypothetical protein FGM01_11785 [Christiangramia sabulilitoris]